MSLIERDDETARQRRALDRANRVRDVAKIFDTSERHIWRLIKRGELKAERLGPRCVRVFDSEIARYRESLTHNAA
jgi:predicted DNA-binding transcriptional regulator AlpA